VSFDIDIGGWVYELLHKSMSHFGHLNVNIFGAATDLQEEHERLVGEIHDEELFTIAELDRLRRHVVWAEEEADARCRALAEQKANVGRTEFQLEFLQASVEVPGSTWAGSSCNGRHGRRSPKHEGRAQSRVERDSELSALVVELENVCSELTSVRRRGSDWKAARAERVQNEQWRMEDWVAEVRASAQENQALEANQQMAQAHLKALEAMAASNAAQVGVREATLNGLLGQVEEQESAELDLQFREESAQLSLSEAMELENYRSSAAAGFRVEIEQLYCQRTHSLGEVRRLETEVTAMSERLQDGDRDASDEGALLSTVAELRAACDGSEWKVSEAARRRGVLESEETECTAEMLRQHQIQTELEQARRDIDERAKQLQTEAESALAGAELEEATGRLQQEERTSAEELWLASELQKRFEHRELLQTEAREHETQFRAIVHGIHRQIDELRSEKFQASDSGNSEHADFVALQAANRARLVAAELDHVSSSSLLHLGAPSSTGLPNLQALLDPGARDGPLRLAPQLLATSLATSSSSPSLGGIGPPAEGRRRMAEPKTSVRSSNYVLRQDLENGRTDTLPIASSSIEGGSAPQLLATSLGSSSSSPSLGGTGPPAQARRRLAEPKTSVRSSIYAVRQDLENGRTDTLPIASSWIEGGSAPQLVATSLGSSSNSPALAGTGPPAEASGRLAEPKTSVRSSIYAIRQDLENGRTDTLPIASSFIEGGSAPQFLAKSLGSSSNAPALGGFGPPAQARGRLAEPKISVRSSIYAMRQDLENGRTDCLPIAASSIEGGGALSNSYHSSGSAPRIPALTRAAPLQASRIDDVAAHQQHVHQFHLQRDWRFTRTNNSLSPGQSGSSPSPQSRMFREPREEVARHASHSPARDLSPLSRQRAGVTDVPPMPVFSPARLDQGTTRRTGAHMRGENEFEQRLATPELRPLLMASSSASTLRKVAPTRSAPRLEEHGGGPGAVRRLQVSPDRTRHALDGDRLAPQALAPSALSAHSNGGIGSVDAAKAAGLRIAIAPPSLAGPSRLPVAAQLHRVDGFPGMSGVLPKPVGLRALNGRAKGASPPSTALTLNAINQAESDVQHMAEGLAAAAERRAAFQGRITELKGVIGASLRSLDEAPERDGLFNGHQSHCFKEGVGAKFAQKAL